MNRLFLAFALLLCACTSVDAASLRLRGVVGAPPIPVPASCSKPQIVDFGGTPTRCEEATENPSFQWTTYFDDVRQSGQDPYYWNYDTIPYDVACVHNGCGYDTTLLVNDPKDISFSASTGSITDGVLTVSAANLDANNGNVAVDQYLTCTGCPTSPRAKITAQLGPTTWQLDQPSLTVSGTPAVTASRYPQINCQYTATRSGISTIPIVYCQTSGDSVTESLIQGYDFKLHGGVWLRIVQGGGAGANGEAGPVKIRHNSFKCNVNSWQTSISTGIGTHFDLYVQHNHHDGGYPTCTGQAFLSNYTVGTPLKSQLAFIEWNAMENEGVLPMSGSGNSGQGGGYYTYLRVANNAVTGTNLSGEFHGAVYALNLGGSKMHQYVYEHNLLHAYPASGPAGLGTTVMSVLANAATGKTTRIDDVQFLGNISVTNIPSVITSPTACSGDQNRTATQTALWQNVGVNSWGNLVSRGNLVDPTGATGCAVYSTNTDAIGTGSIVDNVPGDGKTTLNLTTNNGNLLVNAKIHVNNTPLLWCGTITYNGDSATGSMVLDTTTPTCTGTPPALGVGGTAVAGILVPPGVYVSAKADSTHYTVMNAYCSGGATCTAADLTAPHQRMVSAFSVMPIGTIDPNTGLPSTGTGMNAGTYVLNAEGSFGPVSTWRQFGPAITGALPDVNNGTDMLLSTGAPTYIGGKQWDSGIAP